MIIKATRITTTSSAGAVADYVLRNEKNQEVRLLQGSEAEIHAAMRDAADYGAKYGLRHFQISPEAEMTADDARQILADLGTEFGFDPRTATLVEHQNPRAGGAGFDRHWHALAPEVDALTGKVLDAHWMRPRHEKIARMAEERLGHDFVPGRWNASVARALEAEGHHDLAARVGVLAELPRPESAFSADGHQRGARRGHDLPADRLAVRTAWARSDGAQAFAAALAEQGITVRPGDKAGTFIAERDGHLIGAVHRLAGERKAVVSERLQGVDLSVPASPSALAPSEVPEPTDTPPGGGLPAPAGVSSATVEAASPAFAAGVESLTGAAAPATPPQGGRPVPAAPAAAGGGGGGGAGPASEQPQPAADHGGSEDPTAGIEPPKPGDLRGEIEYRAKIMQRAAEIDARKKAKATPQPRERKGGSSHGSVAMDGGGLSPEQARGIADGIDRFFAELRRGAEREAARGDLARELARFIGDDAPRGERDPRRPVGLAEERGHRGGAEQPGHGYAVRDDGPEGGRRAGQDAGDRGSPREDGGGDAPHGAEDRPAGGEAFRRRCEAARVAASASIIDLSALRAATAALTPDPLAGLDERQRRDAIRAWKEELLSLYGQDREVSRDEGRAAWASRMAAEKLRAEPVAVALRTGWRHLSPQERADGWQAIREARQALIERMKEEAKARPRFGFREWLEGVAEHDAKAAAVYRDGVEKEERKAARNAALDGEQRRIDGIRATAPNGERDPARAIKAIKNEIKTEHAAREKAVQDAAKAVQHADGRVWIWNHLPGLRGPLHAARAAREHARDLALTAEIRAPGRETYRQAERDGTALAERNQKAFDAWQDRHGKALDRDEERLQSIRDAVADGDREMLRALDAGGYAAAKALQDKRDGGGTSGSGMQAGPTVQHDRGSEPARTLPAPGMK